MDEEAAGQTMADAVRIRRRTRKRVLHASHDDVRVCDDRCNDYYP